ncbi:MAG: glycosyltransferase family 39 protein, partial [Roseiflexaceae bacterium]
MKTGTHQLGARADPRLLTHPAVAGHALAWRIPALLAALTLLHGLLYLALLPPWQTPDEPTVFEYAALVAQLGRVPTNADRDLALEQRIADSLTRQHFFEYLTGHAPAVPPSDLEAARASFFMPRQVGSDPPLYFILAALPLKLIGARVIEQQLLALRLLSLLMTTATVLCAYAAARELLPHARGVALAVALGLALQPMFVFIGTGAGNDSLANLIGAAICWQVIRLLRFGASLRRAIALLALLV